MRTTLIFLLAVTAAAAQVRIKLATVLPKGTSYHQILLELREQWRQAPGGGADLVIYEGGVLGDEADIVRKMRIGNPQAALLSVTGLSEIDRAVTALQYMPMMFRSFEEVQHVRRNLEPKLEARLLEKGFVVLFWGDAGWVRFFSKEPLMRPGDFKRVKIFAWAGDNAQVDLMKALGYQPVPLATGDILTGLRTGLISTVPLTPFYALASQVYTSANHMLELNWVPLVGAAVVHRQQWNAIPAATRDGLLKSARQSGETMQTRGRAEADRSVETMRNRWKLQVHGVPPDLEAEWRELAQTIYPKIRGSMVPADMFDEVQTLLEQYREHGGKK